jgi:3-deoxy-7-phosphoheptulonate synthase/chorismate mutase
VKNLSLLRQEIDDINIDILKLINKRTSLFKEIAELKDESDIEYFDAEREAQMLAKIITMNQGPLYNEFVKEIFNSIFTASLKFMGINRDRKLLISSKSEETFNSIQEMFGFSSNTPIIIAGPCAVENPEYLKIVANFLKQKGIQFLRAGAYKPRTSPYEFQGLKEEGLKILHGVAKEYGLFTITEVVDTRNVELVLKYVDILQIGARNMHNFELLKEVGQSKHPILLKRGISATIQEFMFAAEYIVVNGNKNVILCERGIRTYETITRNTLDISSIPIIKNETKLPIIADLSHSLGRKDIVNSIACAVLAAAEFKGV